MAEATLFETNYALSREKGEIVRVLPGLIFVEGLLGVRMGEIVVVENDVVGRVLAVGEHEIKVMVLGSDMDLGPGQKVTRTGDGLHILAGEYLLGKTVDSLGRLEHQRGPLPEENTEWRRVEVAPLGIEHRAESREPLDTGVALVDLMVPLAKGQRELVIGDKKTGKTQFALQTMITQAQQGTICIYAGIGLGQSTLQAARDTIMKAEVENQCVFVTSELGDNPGSIFLTPYTAMTIAEYFRDQGNDVLLILDNMSYHAEYYREVSLLAQSFPGKEAYPGDVFFIHSRLLERAGSVMVNGKRVTITCLPIAETSEGDLAGYIQTNLMSMTDGHLFFDIDLFLAGRRPAINLLLSVTRVGRQTQNQLQHEMGNKLLEMMGEYQKAQGYLRFGAELSGRLREILSRGQRLEATLDQMHHELIDRDLGMVLAGLLWSSDWTAEKTLALKELYAKNRDLRASVKDLIESVSTFEELIIQLKERQASWEVVL